MARAAVLPGASTGENEAIELRDGDKKRYLGKGVLKAVANVNDKIAPALIGVSALQQRAIDKLMIQLDGTKQNQTWVLMLFCVSLAVAKAAAAYLDMPLYRYIGGTNTFVLLAANDEYYQRWIALRCSYRLSGIYDSSHFHKSFSEGLRMGAEVFHSLKKVPMIVT